MRFTLSLDTNNAAFTDRRNEEVAAILRELAHAVEEAGRFEWRDAPQPQFQRWPLFDMNGNRVGTAEYVPEGA